MFPSRSKVYATHAPDASVEERRKAPSERLCHEPAFAAVEQYTEDQSHKDASFHLEFDVFFPN